MDNVLFWRDHERSQAAAHLFVMHVENAHRRRGQAGFTGFVRVIERFEIEERCQAWELVYRQAHDVWCTGPGSLVCGSHGPNCAAVDAVQYWLDSGRQILIHHPRVTVTGIPFLAGVCTIDSQAILKARLE